MVKDSKVNINVDNTENKHLDIYFAGGCFWGTEKYFSQVLGVISTEVGYANGNTCDPTYEEVCTKNTGHAEVVHVVYNPSIISLEFLIDLYFETINPISVNRQGGDTGVQYRTGIYYVTPEDKYVIDNSIGRLQQNYKEPIAIEVKPLENYYKAEEYHQKYLDKNPNGYCHIDASTFENAKESIIDKFKYSVPNLSYIKENLSQIQFDVTQNSATEPPFKNEYWDNFKPGIYVDITTGEPLFSSSDKYESGCGWASFSKAIDPSVTKEHIDKSHGMVRTEVVSRVGSAHLGHVFNDGISELGGQRYCINSAALKFIPKDEMILEGYGHLLNYIK